MVTSEDITLVREEGVRVRFYDYSCTVVYRPYVNLSLNVTEPLKENTVIKIERQPL